ncbi:hypothetical protein NDU88_004190 [Pleurodeles waltl]|uniref:Uncharacterized protein n=1 Tax=Pleurodeles waltl TaxID=8319 RepID=A0AAV7RKA9_PLEWA|nr:hypothetical protein NDU88_004190 [Pleurodeles waltl]
MVKTKINKLTMHSDRDQATLSRTLKDPTFDTLHQLGTTLYNHSAPFAKILQSISDIKKSLEARIDAVSLDAGLLRANHCKLLGTVDETESTVAVLKLLEQGMQKQVREMEKDILMLHHREQDSEGCFRQNNIRVPGFPEWAESPSVELFLENWLTTTMLADKVPNFFSVEQAHRTPGKPPSGPQLLLF